MITLTTLEHPGIAKVAAALAAAGQRAAAEGIRILPADVRIARQAAEALGVEGWRVLDSPTRSRPAARSTSSNLRASSSPMRSPANVGVAIIA